MCPGDGCSSSTHPTRPVLVAGQGAHSSRICESGFASAQLAWRGTTCACRLLLLINATKKEIPHVSMTIVWCCDIYMLVGAAGTCNSLLV